LRSSTPTDEFRVVAILSAYNEADIISPVIAHLVDNGVDVYLIDNRSSDDTVAEAARWLGKGLLKIEQFPEHEPAPGETLPFDWTAILRRKEELARELDADWFLHHDADEFREAPFPGMKLRDAIQWVDRLGYNCIGFRVFNFPPTDDRFQPGSDPREHFRYWEEAAEFDRRQLKAWKNPGRPVSLVPSGGHEVGLPDRRVFPIPFLLRHYPVRGQAHGVRKVFSERRGRFVDRERARQWHIQYDAIVDESHDFLADPAGLRPFDDDQVRLELMLANEITRWAEYQTRQLQSSLEAREKEIAVLRAEKEALTQAAAEVSGLRQRADLHESAQQRVVELERALGREEGRSAELERESAAFRDSHQKTAAAIADLDTRIAELTRAIEVARRSTGWLSSLRRLIEARGRGSAG
jgi:hypothetical protein